MPRIAHARRRPPGPATAAIVLLGLALTGCLPGGAWPFGAPTTPDAAPTPTVVATPDRPTPTASAAPSTLNPLGPEPAPPTVTVPNPPAPAPPAARTVTGSTIGFASPSGNIVCTMRASGGVHCAIREATWKGSAVPKAKQRNCDATEPFGHWQELLLDETGAWGHCATEATTMEAYFTLDGAPNALGREFRTWHDPQRDATFSWGSVAAAPVLPYGGTATTGRYRCVMATTGVSCTDTATGAGFLLSRAKVRVF